MKMSIGSVAGIVAIVIYLISALTSFLYYPKPYSPFTNRLSDLGNPIENPAGAVFHNLGCILTSIPLIIFCVGFYKWKIREGRIKILLIITQIVGIFSTLSLIMLSIFSLGTHTETHYFWSMMFFVSLTFFQILSASVLLEHPASIKWIAYYGFLATAINFITGVILSEVFIGEWITVTMAMGYVLIISFNSKIINK